MDALGFKGLAHEDGCLRLECLCLFRSQEACGASHRDALIHFRVAAEVVLQALCYVAALFDDVYVRRHVLAYLTKQQGIVCAAEDDAVDERVTAEQALYALADEVVRSWTVVFVVLYQRHPHGAGFSCHLNVGAELGNLQLVGMAAYGAWRGHDAHMTRSGYVADDLDGGTYHAQHASLRVEKGQVPLLDATQRLGRCGVAGQDDEVAALLEQIPHSLERELIDEVEGACAVGSAGVVAKVEVIVLRHQPAYLAQDSQSAIARVEDTDGTPLP